MVRGGGGGRGGAAAVAARRGGGAAAAGAAAAARRRGAGWRRRARGGKSREWFRPNPDPGNVNWGPRAHVNMSQSGVLFALSFTGKDKERWLENYWIKNRNAVDKGKNGPTFGWVIPATQHEQGERGRSRSTA